MGNRKSAVILGASLFLMLLSLSAYMMHWRVSNEPGAQPIPMLITVHWILLAGGALGYIFTSISIVRKNLQTVRIFLLPTLIAIFCYLPILAITLLMMV